MPDLLTAPLLLWMALPLLAAAVADFPGLVLCLFALGTASSLSASNALRFLLPFFAILGTGFAPDFSNSFCTHSALRPLRNAFARRSPHLVTPLGVLWTGFWLVNCRGSTVEAHCRTGDSRCCNSSAVSACGRDS